MPHADKGPRRYDFTMPSTGEVVPVYSGLRLGRALDAVMDDMTLYQGVRLAEVIEAVYAQGFKDGSGQRHPGRPRLN